MNSEEEKRVYEAAAVWLERDRDPETRGEISKLVADENAKALADVLTKGRLRFGTAGLRAPMRAGYNGMNCLVVLQSARGLCEYLKKTCPERLRTGGVAIGFDGRHRSRKFAELTANVFVRSSVKVYLFGEVCPTPWVSFAVRELGAAAGVMVTASHNPKEDNGYKVYWGNAAQIVDPHDRNIEKEILDNLEIDAELWNIENVRNHPLVVDNLDDLSRKYFNRLRTAINPDLDEVLAKAPAVAYSAMHGVGYPYLCEAFRHFNLSPVMPVNEQCYPDPDFPTVRFPNPEEPSSLAMSLELAKNNKCTVVLANDPDADRLAVAEFQPREGRWHIFTGNEIGTVLGWWVLECFKRDHPDVDPSSAVLLSSAVSSKMLKTIATIEGATYIETLTGFKWMGNKCIEIQNDMRPIFAYEEAIGFMCGINVPDKDGISAAVHLMYLFGYLATQQETLLDHLSVLHEKFGYHLSNNSYFSSPEPQIFKNIINELRTYRGTSEYPKYLRDWKICHVRDLGMNADETASSGTGLDRVLSSGEMLTFTFENGLVATIRTSGTEPKIKYYTELCAKPGQGNKEEISKLLDEMVSALIEDFLQPTKHNLIARK